MRKLILTTTFLFLVVSNNVYAQTRYENEKKALTVKLFNDLELDPSSINKTGNLGGFFDVIMKKMQTASGFSTVRAYLVKLNSLEGLKTKDDFKKSPNASFFLGLDDEIVMISGINDGPKQELTPDDNAVYSFVSMENPPSFPGGIEKFYKFIDDNKKYPTAAVESNIQGNVFVSFTIEKDGSLSDIKVARKLGYGTDEEAVRVLKLSRRWNPGMQNGKPVRVKYNIAIKFSLAQ